MFNINNLPYDNLSVSVVKHLHDCNFAKYDINNSIFIVHQNMRSLRQNFNALVSNLSTFPRMPDFIFLKPGSTQMKIMTFQFLVTTFLRFLMTHMLLVALGFLRKRIFYVVRKAVVSLALIPSKFLAKLGLNHLISFVSIDFTQCPCQNFWMN